MLEDDFTYVIRKAFKGLALSPGEAALRAGLPETEVLAFSRGKFSAATARALAPVLGLDPEALATHLQYEPQSLASDSIHRLELPFGGEHVNAWLISKNGTHLLFDTGDDKTSCANKLDELHFAKLDAIFITHAHHDHLAGLSTLRSRSAEVYDIGSIKAGASVQIGNLTISAIDLAGHAKPALGFLISGLERPVLVAGDAIFAGSVGGIESSVYHEGLARIQSVVRSLATKTIILPGHGPATTIEEERQRNPFLAP